MKKKINVEFREENQLFKLNKIKIKYLTSSIQIVLKK